MIVEAVITVVKNLLFMLFGVINLPPFPEALKNGIDSFLSLVFDNLGLITLAIRWNTVLIAIPLLIAIINFDHIYDAVIWILKKIPFLGMS